MPDLPPPPMDRRAFLVKSLGLAGAAALPARGADLPATKVREGRPPFSWDHIPVYRHCGPWRRPFTPAERDLLAGPSGFLTIERADAGNEPAAVDENLFAAARDLKQRNPDMVLLMYWNTFINRSPSVRGWDPAWNLKDSQGRDIVKFGRFPRPDLSLPDVRHWWSEVVAESMRKAPFDGIFADALPQVLTPALPRQLGEDRAARVREGLESMLAMTREKIGKDRIILANGLRGSSGRNLLDWPSLSGLLIEHFASFGSTDTADMREDLASMALAEKKGKFCVLKGWPGFSWMDPTAKETPYDALLRLARERITFPLACFLIGARPGSCFSYSWGYLENHGMLEPYPEFLNPLGPPSGDAAWKADTATRTFARARVAVDLASRSAQITWA